MPYSCVLSVPPSFLVFQVSNVLFSALDVWAITQCHNDGNHEEVGSVRSTIPVINDEAFLSHVDSRTYYSRSHSDCTAAKAGYRPSRSPGLRIEPL